MFAEEAATVYARPLTATYSQHVLLKNWALSVCLGTVAKDPDFKADASATASAYMEYGDEDMEAHDALRTLATTYAARRYGGSIAAEFRVMKCIDMYHSKELHKLVSKLAQRKK